MDSEITLEPFLDELELPPTCPKVKRPTAEAERKRLRALYKADPDAKLRQMADWLYEASEIRAEGYIGGYPDEVEIVGDYIVVASTEDNKPVLEVFGKEYALRWHDAVLDYLLDPETDPDDSDIGYAVEESRPSEELE